MLPPGWITPRDAGWWRERPELGLEGHFLDFLAWAKEEGEGRFRPVLDQLVRDTSLAPDLGDWRAFLGAVIDDGSAALGAWRQDYRDLLDAWQAIGGDGPIDRVQANMLRYRLDTLHETTVIEALADRQFLPRYGFPVGLQRLRVVVPDDRRPGCVREEDQFRLERSGLLSRLP
jgi:hypothetical protein